MSSSRIQVQSTFRSPSGLSQLGRFSKMIRVAVLLCASTVVTVAARADYDAGENFAAQVRVLGSKCRDTASCRAAGLNLNVLLVGSAVSPGVLSILPRLNVIVEAQSMIWADTILGGDYQAENRTTIDRVEGVSRNGQLLWYRVTYSSRAWTQSDSGAKANEGRIEETSLVSPTLSSWARDELASAQFKM